MKQLRPEKTSDFEHVNKKEKRKPKLIALCLTLTFASFCHAFACHRRRRGQLSVAVEVVTRSDLVFTKALLSCVTWSSRDCSDNSTGSHIFDSAWRLFSQRTFFDCKHHHSSRRYATRPVASRPQQPSLSTRWTTCE